MSKHPHIESLKKRADFLRLGEGSLKSSNPVFLLLSKPNHAESDIIRIGYTVTKKIGNAVVRNRIKRRFRAAVRDIFPENAKPGHDYVMIARSKAPDILYGDLRESLRFALIHLHKAPQKRYEKK